MTDQEYHKIREKFSKQKEEFSADEMIEVMAFVLKQEPFDKVVEQNPFIIGVFAEFASRVVATLFCMKEREGK